MTLGTTISTVSYTGDGSTVDFNVTFEFHAATDIEVIVVTELTGAESLKTGGGVDYGVSGGDGSTGQVTFNVAPLSTERVVIRRVSPDVQPDDLIDGGPLDAESLERRLDIISARLQELATDIARSLKVAKGSQAPESGLTLNLTGGMGNSLAVSNDELGIIIAAAVAPDDAVLSPKGEEFVGLSNETAMRSFLGLTTAATTAIGTSGATIPLLNGANTFSGALTFSGDATFDSDVILNAPVVIGREVLTIDSGGAVMPTKSRLLINNFGAASTDNLDTINVTNHPFGSVIEVQAGTSGQVPTLRHAVGNIYLDEDRNVTLDDRDKVIWLQRRDASDGEHNAGWYEIGRSFALRKAGDILQTVFATDATEYTITTVIPEDTTVPQNTEGDEITPLNTSVTPRDGTSKLRFTLSGLFAANNTRGAVALFKDSDADAVAVGGFINDNAAHFETRTFRWYLDAANTTARIYKVRVGPTSGTVYLNRSSTANLFGSGSLVTSLTIDEIAT